MSAPEMPGAPSPGGPAPAEDSARHELADGEWHRLHPLTPLFKGGLVLIVVAGIVISNFRDRFIQWLVNIFTPGELDDDAVDYAQADPIDWILTNNLILIALLVLLGVLVVLILIFWLVWRFQEFRISDEHVEVRKGIVFRSHRRAPLDRVQGVNLTRPFPARLIGLAKLEVVGAGTDANVPLEYLSTARAEAVRADILRLASGARAARAAARSGTGPDAASAPHTTREAVTAAVNDGVTGLIAGVDLDDVVAESIVKIPTGRLVGSQLIVGALWAVMFLLLFGAIMAFSIFGMLADGDFEPIAIVAIALGMGIPFVIAVVAITWAQISRSLRYSIAPTSDGIRITYGLFTTVTETIPPGRIFAVEVTQSLLWRPFGWWAIKINRMSGKSAAQQQSSSAQQFNIVLPVGVRADVERVLELLLPNMPAEHRPGLWEHGMEGPTEGDPFERMPRRAWWRRPLSWRRHGVMVTDHAVIMRRGRLWRKLAVFPLVRMQGVSVHQGPIDRAQRVGWLKVHSVTGPVLGDIVGIDRDALLRTLDETSRRASDAVREDAGHRWAEVVRQYAVPQAPAVVGGTLPPVAAPPAAAPPAAPAAAPPAAAPPAAAPPAVPSAAPPAAPPVPPAPRPSEGSDGA